VVDGEKIQRIDSGRAVAWDVGDMITVYGTVLGIEVTREEISILFGSRTVHTGRRNKTVVVSDRIVVSPFTAKRMLVLLRKVMERQQPPFGMERSDLRTFLETTN